MAWRIARSLFQGSASAEGARTAASTIAPRQKIAPPEKIAPPPQLPPRPSSRVWTRSFSSLTDANYRWFFFAMVGHWGAQNMQLLVRGYLVYEITGSYAALGVMSLANAFPMLALSAVGGILADRFDKKKVLQLGQLLSIVLSVIIAILLFADALRFWHLVVAGAAQGAIMALSMPARQSMIPNLVRGEWLMNAIALNAAGMNLLRLVAPALGGVVLDVVGGSWVYVLMSAFYAAAIITLIPVRMHADAATPPVRNYQGMHRGGRRGSRSLSELWDGFLYVRQHAILAWLLLINLCISFLAHALPPTPPRLRLRRLLGQRHPPRRPDRHQRRRRIGGSVGPGRPAQSAARLHVDR